MLTEYSFRSGKACSYFIEGLIINDSNSEQIGENALGGENTLELIAGRHPNGELIVERLLVSPQSSPQEPSPQGQANSYQLLKSPVFVRGIARADVIQPLEQSKGAFKVLQHGGNLCIRLFSKLGFTEPKLEALEQSLTAAIEKLGGDLDVREERVLVYSIHVSCGFNEVEKLLNEKLAAFQDVNWYYGNVYDPDTGEPLNWWQAILAPS
ncbi:MAG: DUF4265 domain-containing protein [Pseudomonadales bacterium]